LEGAELSHADANAAHDKRGGLSGAHANGNPAASATALARADASPPTLKAAAAEDEEGSDSPASRASTSAPSSELTAPRPYTSQWHEMREQAKAARADATLFGQRRNLLAANGDKVAAFRCLARHPMMRKRVWRAPTGDSLLESELASISGGDGADPLLDLLTLFPPSGGSGGDGSAWAVATSEGRAHVLRLLALRGERLAAQESRPPLVHWIVLSLTGSSLLLGFTIICYEVRPPHSVLSRLLFALLAAALHLVGRLLADLNTPFDAGSSFTLKADNAAGAILDPTRRRLVAVLTRILERDV